MKKIFYTLLTITILIFSALTYSYTSSSTIFSSLETPDPGHNANQVTVKIGAAYKTLQKAIEDGDFQTAETDPQVGYLSTGKWCREYAGTVRCDQNAPLTSETDPQVGSTTIGKWCRGTGTQVTCDQNAPASSPWTTSGTNIYKSTGNIGIGTSSPSQKLDVNGNIRWGTSKGLLTTNQGASIELGGIGTPFIDFSNDLYSDYDMRLILTNNNRLDIEGGDLYVKGTKLILFGGIYQEYACPGGGCRKTNPLTGSCSCPSGYTASAFSDFDSPTGAACGSQSYYESKGMILYFCYKS